MVASLGLSRMSKDDSDDKNGRLGNCNRNRRFVINILDWCSDRLELYLDHVDHARQPINPFGKPPGNVPRQSVQHVGVKVLRVQAVPGLPQNFYDDMWVAGLSGADRSAL